MEDRGVFMSLSALQSITNSTGTVSSIYYSLILFPFFNYLKTLKHINPLNYFPVFKGSVITAPTSKPREIATMLTVTSRAFVMAAG